MPEQTDATEMWDGHVMSAHEATTPELKRLREAQIERSFAAAAADPLYMRDLEECMRDFAEIDRDSLQYMDEEPRGEE